ncbi:hypothetical protein RvY_03598-1 [Ramazzottius varieornatus]|uniref:Thyrotropin-releasing hormone receptor n=1 Tax=Ramazzottius varieornatus TaxID=947166 RepID=A0A1D1UUB2_RAMVA|nr:hypothetical protein RvY_03598-1 [Ramazzottius varieornatus]
MSNNSSSEVDSAKGATTLVPQQLPLEYRVIASIVHIIIFIIGFFGNISVVIVVRRTKSMHSPTYCYLVSLAVADLLVVVSAIPEAIMSHHLYAGQWVLGHAGCSVLIFGNFLGINASSIRYLPSAASPKDMYQ